MNEGSKTDRNPAPSDHYSRVLWDLQRPPRGAGRVGEGTGRDGLDGVRPRV